MARSRAQPGMEGVDIPGAEHHVGAMGQFLRPVQIAGQQRDMAGVHFNGDLRQVVVPQDRDDPQNHIRQ